MAWENWSGSVRCEPAALFGPADEAGVVDVVKRALEAGKTLRTVGSGHSFTPLVATDQWLMHLDRLQGLIAVEPGSHRATAWAGTKLKALGEALFDAGLAQENLGDINVQSLAGAIGTGTHGTGAGLKAIANQVVALTLVTGTGEVLTCSETDNREVFKAAQVSLGALGVITRVELQCVPAYKLKLIKGKAGFEETLGNLAALARENRHFEFFWFPHSDVVATKTTNVTDEPIDAGGLGKILGDVVLENGGLWAVNEICRTIPALSKACNQFASQAAGTGSEVDWSHRIFATPRLVKFQEMEYNVPIDQAADTLLEIRDCIRTHDFAVGFPLEVRFGTSDDIFLSPTYQRDAVYIAVHMYQGMAHEAYFAALEAIFKRRGGRPHWGKLHTLGARDFEALYPEWERFQAVRRELDPHGVFMNDYLQRLFGHD